MTSNVDPSKLSLNVKGAYTSPAVPRDFDIKTASATDLAHYGFPEGIKARIDSESSPFHRLFTRTWLPEHRIIPQLEVKIGRTHLLQPSSEQQKVRTDAPNTSNNWSGAVVASVKTAPLAKPGSPLDGYATEFSQQQHVNYIGVDNHIYELYYINVWKFSDLTQGAGAPATSPLSTLHGYATAFNQQQHVNYIGSDGHVHELVYDGAWKHNDLSAMAGATAAAPGSPLDGYATSFNQQQHVNYIGTDGHVHELVYDGAWKHNDLTTTAGASFPAAGSPLDGYSTEFNQQQHVNFIGTDGHVHELVYDGAWKHNDLSATAGAPAVASGSPLDGYTTSFNQQQHVNYIGTDGHVHELVYDGAWKHNDLSASSGAPVAASRGSLDGYATSFNQQQHVNYIGTDGHVHELVYDGAWKHNDLTTTAGASPSALGSPLDGYSTEFNRQQHINYIGADGHIHELFYTTQWNSNDLTASALLPWTEAFGSWVIPTVSVPDEPEGPEGGWSSSSWIGIDGAGNNDVLQAGIEQDLTSDGSVSYYPWFEWFAPDQDGSPDYVDETRILNMSVAPGQEIFCSVQYINNNSAGRIFLSNMTTGNYYTVDLEAPPGAAFDGNSVEWIMEVVTVDKQLSSLPQFTPVEFQTALGSNLAGDYADPINGSTFAIVRGTTILTAATVAHDTVNIRYLPWHDTDLMILAGAPPVALGYGIDGYVTSFNQQQHVDYVANDGHIHELVYDSGWKHNDLTAAAGDSSVVRPGSPLDGYATSFNQQQHVNYIGTDGHVHELVYDGAWKHNDLTSATGAPSPAGSSLDGYSTEFNQQQHVNYIGSDGHVHELVYDGAWKHNDLSATAGATAAAPGSPLDGYATSFNQQQHVNYIGTDGHVHELVYDGAWKHNDLTTTAGASFPAPGSPLDGYSTEFNQQQHVNYIGTDGHVHELVYDGAWKHNDLSATAGAPAVASGSPLDGYPTSYNQQQHVNYIGTDGHVYELFYDGQWKTNDLRNASGFLSTLASATRLVGFETAFNQQQHVFFISVDNHLHELYW